MEDLHPAIERIHYINAVVVVDEQSGGQLEFAQRRAAVAEGACTHRQGLDEARGNERECYIQVYNRITI